MKPVLLAPLAEDEVREALGWYEEQAHGLGWKFGEALNLVFSGIADNPLRFPKVHREIRRATVRRFPYGVFFLDQPEAILVIAVVHLHRHPDTWKRR